MRLCLCGGSEVGKLCTLLSFFLWIQKYSSKIKFIKKKKKKKIAVGTGGHFLSHRDLIWGEEKYFKYIIVIFFHIVHSCTGIIFTWCWLYGFLKWLQESILRISQKSIGAGHDNAKHDNVFIEGQEKATSAE